jgi:hypothetical protein
MAPRLNWLACVASILFSATGATALAEPIAKIPPRFQGAGCNLKYVYARTPRLNASDCIAAKEGHKDGDAHDNDNFIRITEDGVAGVEWGCSVKTAKTMNEAEFTFAGECSDEGTSSSGTITLLLRPGRLVIVDQVTKGQHIIDIYHLLDGLR